MHQESVYMVVLVYYVIFYYVHISHNSALQDFHHYWFVAAIAVS